MKHAGQTHPTKQRKRAVVLTGYTVLLLFITGITELALRITMPQLGAEGWSAGAFCSNENLGYNAMVPGAATEMVGQEFGRIKLVANSKGYRGAEWPTNDSAIIVLGDSFGWGWGVEDSAMWRAALPPSMASSVVNLSMPGDDWFRMQHRLRMLQADIPAKHIIVLAYINDFFGLDDQLAKRDSLNQSGFYEDQHLVMDGCQPIVYKGQYYPFNRLYLYKLVRGIAVYLSQRNEGERLSDYHARIGYRHDSEFLSNESFQTVCTRYCEALHEAANGLPMTVVYIPPVYAIDSSVAKRVTDAAELPLTKYLEFQTALTQRFLNEENIQFYTTYPALSEAHSSSSAYFLNDGHLNKHGQRVLGECIADAILSHSPKTSEHINGF